MSGNARPRLVAVLVAVAVVVAGGLTAVVLLARPTSGIQAAAVISSRHTTTTSAPAPTSAATTTARTTSIGASRHTEAALPFGHLPLWPFASQADADAWQAAFRSGGHQPWHLDAAQTALSFTRGYLGYTDVDKVIDVEASGRDDLVSVGFDNPHGQPVISAVLHLARFGRGAGAPWEVVGTQDTTLTLTTPAYGATVRSPVTAGGQITGVDENLRVQIRQLDRPTPITTTSGVPAGGDRAQWTVKVPFPAGNSGIFTIAVATGGHLAEVERFAITGVRR